jgi:iron complex transport system ATP-binding protein
VEELIVTELQVEHLTISRGSRCVLQDLSLHVRSRERVAVVGPNGSGKTTLLRAILGLLPVAKGHIFLDGVPTQQLRPLERAAKLAWLPQQALAEEPITALEFVRAARFRFQETSHAARGAALRALQSVGAEDWADSPVTCLSGGEQQRVALAALFAQEATLLLADEPANHLDPAQQASAWRLLERAAASSTVLVVTHDINLVPLLGELSDTRVVALNHGRIAFDVMASDMSLPDLLCKLYGIEMQVFGSPGYRVIVPRALSECQP